MTVFWNTLISVTESFNNLFRTEDAALYLHNHIGAVLTCIVAVLMIGLGIAFSFVGDKFIKVSTVFLAIWVGILLGRGVIYPFIEAHATLTEGWATAFKIALPVIVAVLVAVLAYKVTKLVFFIAGGLVGFFGGHALAAAIQADTVATLIIIGLGVLLLGLIALLVRKAVIKGCFIVLGSLLAAFGASLIAVVASQSARYVLVLLISFIVALVIILVCQIVRSAKHRSSKE